LSWFKLYHRIWIAGPATASAVIALIVVATSTPTRVENGRLAPDFSANVVDSPATAHSLREYRGRVVILNIWASWCGPCREEMASLEKVHEALSSKGLRVVAVSVDGRGMRDAVRQFVRSRRLTFDVLNDGSGMIQRAYQTIGIPSTFIIDQSGIIRDHAIGARNWDSAVSRSMVEGLLTRQDR
jgi:peroxiredoxin